LCIIFTYIIYFFVLFFERFVYFLVQFTGVFCSNSFVCLTFNTLARFRKMAKSKYYLDTPDEELMLELQQGRDEAFNEIVGRYKDYSVRFCYRFVRDFELAEDISQEGFIRLYKFRHKYKIKAKFITLLSKILMNLCLDEFRKRKSYKTLEIDALPDGGIDKLNAHSLLGDESSPNPEQEYIQKELGEEIKHTLNSLSPRYRTVLILRLFHGYSYKEIAEIMGASLNEVKIWIHRARNQMKDKFSYYLKRCETNGSQSQSAYSDQRTS
jgi:RNA polymerase sigma-70 factor, ECF subfamily